MTAINWGELFPTRLSGLIFVAYMSLFVSQGRCHFYKVQDKESINPSPPLFAGILVTASQDSNSQYSYNTVTLVLLTEVLKLVVSAAIYAKQ